MAPCRITFDAASSFPISPSISTRSRQSGYNLTPLDEIHEKHLNLFLPYTLLRLKPRLRQISPLTKEELTSFVKKIIVILEEDVASGHLTPQQSYDYVRLFTHASEHIFRNHPYHHEDVLQLTKPLITLSREEARTMTCPLDRYFNFLRTYKHNKYRPLNKVRMLDGANHMPSPDTYTLVMPRK